VPADSRPQITAFVLAGGRSTRMGRDKAFIEFGGSMLLERAIALAKSAADDVFLIGPKVQLQAYGRVRQDQFPGQGPLAGIHAALRATSTDRNLILAVDTPFLTPAFLSFLIGRAATDAVVTVPRCADVREPGEARLHPLCAVYRRSFADVAERALRAGDNKIEPLFEQVATHIIGQSEIEQRGFSPNMFRNLNTPEDLGGAVIDFLWHNHGS